MIGEALLGGLRLAHALSAALWVGGTLVCFLVSPGLGDDARRVWRPFRDALRVGIGVFVLTGAIMTVERLSSATLPPTYFGVLVLKVGLGIWLFNLGRRVGTGAGSDSKQDWWRRPEAQVIAAGATIYALAIALRAIYENALRG